MRTRPLLLIVPVALMSVVLVGCGGSSTVSPPSPVPATPSPSGSPTVAPTSPTSPSVPPEVTPIEASWTDDVDIDLGDGLRLGRCGEGDAPLLCVLRHGQPIGAIGLGIHPEEGLDAEPSQADIEARATDFLDAFAEDRAAGCGAFTFTPSPARPATFADGPGATAGFTLTDESGRIVEEVVVFVTLRDGAMWVAQVDAYVTEGGCLPPDDEAFDFTPVDLAVVAPELAAIVAGTTLPPR